MIEPRSSGCNSAVPTPPAGRYGSAVPAGRSGVSAGIERIDKDRELARRVRRVVGQDLERLVDRCRSPAECSAPVY